MRMAQQICGDLADGGALKVLRLGNRWDLAFHQSLKRDTKGEIVEFDIDPRLIEQFGTEASKAIRGAWTGRTSSCWSRRRMRGLMCAWSSSGCFPRCPCSPMSRSPGRARSDRSGTIS